MSQVEIVDDTRARLGESPLWCAERDRLYWVDIHGRCVHALDHPRSAAAVHRRWRLPLRPSALGLRDARSLVVAAERGIGFLDTEDGGYTPAVALESAPETNRSNEGKCDRRGRFWVGTMDDRERAVTGALYRVAPDLTVTRVLEDIGIPNTLVWTPDDRQMYFADSVRGEIYCYDFDAETGAPTNARVFARVPAGSGAPDGSTLDRDGCLWTAVFGGGRLIRWTPEGEIEREIALPVRQPTSCIFGGAALDTLFVTSASVGLDADVLAREPHNGKLLALHAPAGSDHSSPAR